MINEKVKQALNNIVQRFKEVDIFEAIAFSKKVENLGYALALHFMYYNFCRIHQTLRVTPAMAAKVTDRIWDIENIIALLKLFNYFFNIEFFSNSS